MESSASEAPDRWLGCPPFGDLVDDTFLPMKTLLSEEISLPHDYEFTPEIFFKAMKDRKINVGLIINLTFTQRYYDSNDLIDNQDIQYKQISCRGFNEAPQAKERDEFIRVCDYFLSKNPNKVIAVHCTHGFNRTGFMICSYLCRIRDWAVDAAINHFSLKRPPGIYKQQYLNELINIFGDRDDPIIEAPPRPNWDSDEGGISNLHGADASSDNQVGLNQQEFYEGITDVQLVRDEALKQRIYRHCCFLCNYRQDSSSINFPGAQPVSMDRENIKLLKLHRYRVSWKADGCRYMMYIQDEDNIFLLTRSLQLWRVVGLKFPRVDDTSSHITDTFVDGEMVTDIIRDQRIPRYLIYDVISLNGKIVAKENFDKRCYLIKHVIIDGRLKAKKENPHIFEGEPFKVADKGFFYLHKTQKTWELQVTHEKDGLIFQPFSAPYTGGTCTDILKWKPPSHNSIDFRLVIREERQNGCIPENYVYLHVSNKADPITKFKIDRKELANYEQYNNRIVEMTLINQRWQVMRERTDKLTPNSFETAVATFRSIKQPVTEKDLLDFIASIPPESKG